MSSKKMSNCVACAPSKTKKKKSELLTHTQTFPAPWLQDLGRSAIPRHSLRFQTLEAAKFAPTYPLESDLVIEYTHTDLPKKVVYWAAGPCDIGVARNLQSAESAYGKYENMGVAVRRKNTLTFVLQSPRAYIATQRGKTHPQLWCRHLHFVEVDQVSNRVPESNQNVLFTLGVFPCTLLSDYKGVYACRPLLPIDTLQRFSMPSLFVGYENYVRGKQNGAVGVCAVDHSDYPAISGDDLVIDWKHNLNVVDQRIRAHPRVKEQGVHCPLIVYCVHEKCAAAQALVEKLCTLGFCNVYYMKYGMKEADNKKV